MKFFHWAAAVTVSLLLCSCASDNGVDVFPSGAGTYAAVPVSNVNVSTHPPKGQYVSLAKLSVVRNQGETPTQLLQRLQNSAASIGANYVMVTSISDQSYLDSDAIDSNPYLSTTSNFFSTASGSATGYNNIDQMGDSGLEEVVTAQALRITSGSNQPNKKAPSMVPKKKAAMAPPAPQQ